MPLRVFRRYLDIRGDCYSQSFRTKAWWLILSNELYSFVTLVLMGQLVMFGDESAELMMSGKV